ncbi:pyridoxamine 5'-phosphate oxidase family protein [Ideonella sp. BN130291]|uniref:pyridoxamine 5'-phosphate oxidase family protein n=1 Tax=Ideonella sp. BN130291 TaxID=3112940 RepID=UPI002E253866|nr:pyridoxamine 5'-phosphate oxidase family protein [Ideonella sp. BN130291]
MSELPGWPHAAPPFHPGEQAQQARAGVRERMAAVGYKVVRTQMPEQHRELFEKLPFMLLGALDAQRRPWASVLVGEPGFVHTPDAATLAIAARPLVPASLELPLHAGAAVGLLGIEPATRRRNRLNGVLGAADAGHLQVHVRQSFGNCPKYIQARDLRPVPATPAQPVAFTQALPPDAAQCIAQADTFFIATASPDAGLPQQAAHGGVDVSHRGGKPGFVHVQQVGGRTVLTAPDFIGNFFFNTLGNIAANPLAGLLFIDWTRGDLLMLTAQAEVLWDGPELHSFAGAQRLLRLRVDEGHWWPGAWPLRASEVDYAPQLAATGTWDDSAAAAPR